MQEITYKNKSVKIKDGVIVECSAESTPTSSLRASNSERGNPKKDKVDCHENPTNFLAMTDCILAPQFIDLNVFPKNKSLSRNSILSLSKKAKAGGVGVIALNSALNPAIDNEMAIEFIKNISSEVAILPLIASNALDSAPFSKDSALDSAGDAKEGKICDIAILNALGGVGINIDSAKSANTIDKVAKYAKMLDIPLFINANDNLGGIINYGQISAELGIPARNPLSEIKEVAKMLEVAIFYGIKVVFSAISEPRSLALIKEAKRHNPQIFVEVSAHHLLLNDEACSGYNTAAKINPPLKDKSTQECLLRALQDGEIDVLTSLQCAVFNSKKDLPFGSAEYGIDAISHYFALLYSNLVEKKVIGLERLFEVCAENPAKILGLNCGKIEKGKEARLMVVDLDSTIQVNDAFSPYNGAELKGQILRFV